MAEGLASEGATAGGAISAAQGSRGAGGVKAADGMVLQRMLRPQAIRADPGEEGSRAVRLAVVRAAEAQAGIVVTVPAITMEALAIEALVARLDAGLMLMAVSRRGQEGPVGFVAFDAELRAAVIEAQTLGKPLDRPASPRPPTRADHAMAEPLVAGILDGLRAEAAGTALAGWCDDTFPDGPLGGPREVGLRLAAGDYRILRLSVDLGVGDRSGQVLIVLPLPRPCETGAMDGEAEWRLQLQRAVLGARSDLRAVLHRERMTLKQVEALHVGQVLALPGVTVSAVRLEAIDGRAVASGRLGQIGGMKAVRIETAGGAPARKGAGMGQMVLAPAAQLPAARAVTSVEGAEGRPTGRPLPVGGQGGPQGRAQGGRAGSLPEPAGPVGTTDASGGAGLATAHDLRPEDPEVDAEDRPTIPPDIQAAMPTGLAVSFRAGRPGALDLSDEVDLGESDR